MTFSVKKLFFLSLPLIGFATENQDVEKIVKFFTAKGVLIKQIDKNRFISDKGLPYFRKGFPVKTLEGTEVENPLTHKKVFVVVKETGKGMVENSFPTNAIIKLTENNGTKVGNIVTLNADKVCFEGSDFLFEKLSETLPVVKIQNPSECKWEIKETENGFKVLYNQNEIYFVRKSLPSYAYGTGKADIGDITILARPFLVSEYSDLPVGVDTEKLGKTIWVAVGFQNQIKLYQKVGNSLTEVATLPTPAGTLEGLQLVNIEGQLFIVGVNFTSDAEPSSFVAKLVGTNPVIIQQAIPYYIAVLDKNRPEETLIAQKFEGGFTETYKAEFTANGIKVGKKIKMPEGFRADSAVLNEYNELAFIDSGGTFRIYRGSLEKGFQHIMDIEGDFGKSYNYIDLPNVMGNNVLRKFYFHPRPVYVQLFGFKGFLVAENKRAKIVPILADKFVKFTKGRLYFIGRNRKGFYEKKAIRGAIFNDNIQGVNIDKAGTPFILSLIHI
jgi:hypothetical protein